MADPYEDSSAVRQEPTTLESAHPLSTTSPASKEYSEPNTSSKALLAVLECPTLLKQSETENEEIGQAMDIRTPIELLQSASSLQLEGVDRDSIAKERMQESCSSEKLEHGLCAGPGRVSEEHSEDTEHSLCTVPGSIGKDYPEKSNMSLAETQMDDHGTSATEKCSVKETESSDMADGGEPPKEEHMETEITVQHTYVRMCNRYISLSVPPCTIVRLCFNIVHT